MARRIAWLSLAALLLTSLVLRPPVAAVGPLLGQIATDLKLDLAQQGLLTSIPVFSFGIGAFAGPWLARTFGLDRLIVLLLAVLSASILIRGTFGYVALLAATVAAGLSIAVMNVVLPTVVRGRFKNHVAQVTSAYTMVLALSASISAAVAVPLAQVLQSWNLSLMVWFIPSVLALAMWFWQSKAQHPKTSSAASSQQSVRSKAIARSKVTWALFAFFGIQSFGFYFVLSWLPLILIERGFDQAAAGGMLGLVTIVGVPTGFALASNLSRFKNLARLGFVISLVTLAGFSLLLMPSFELPAGILIGLGQAASFPLSLTLISTRASDSRLTTALSAFVQGWGYLLSAVGTYAVAVIRDLTGSWTNSIALLVFFTAIQAASSFEAGGKHSIHDPELIAQTASAEDETFDLFDRK